jgi:YARHG domain
MRFFYFCLLILSFSGVRANDGSFYASGNTLIPLKETTIQMKKEILSLERRGHWMQVDIYFEFFNPGPEKELTVGFVTPPASGDVTDEEAGHPQVKDFMVMSGDRILSYKIARMEASGFKVSDKLANGFDFVYYFTIRFAKGITVIRHSYLYRGGSSVEASAEFYYRLTTGTSWAGGAIGDFELNINMGDDSYFAIPAAFTSTPAAWTMVGVGRISRIQNYNPYGDEDGGHNLRMAMIRRGKLQLRSLGFKPVKDLSIVIFQLHNEINLWMEGKEKNELADFREIFREEHTDSVIRSLSDFQLRLYRNLNYARAGYAFKDESLTKIFSNYNWYLPDPAIKPEQAPEIYIPKEIMKKILEEEGRRKESGVSS